MGANHEDLGGDIWRLRDGGMENLLVSLAGPIVVFRLKIMDLPKARREALFETLLRLNTTELFHCAFGLEDNAVVLTGALPLENLDFNEFSGTLDDFALAISNHYPQLREFVAEAA